MENISTEDQETIREFLVESYENLSRLDQDLVELEKHPGNRDLLGSIFRTIHTIKGACGFLSFAVLEGITHQAESLLSQLRDGKRELTPALVSLILETVDATRKVMASIETSGTEGALRFEDLTDRLRAAAQLPAAVTMPPSLAEPEPVTPAGPAPTAVAVTQSPGDSPAEPPPDTGERRRRGERNDAGREGEAGRSSAAVDSNIRVGVGLLDKLMDLVGEPLSTPSRPPVIFLIMCMGLAASTVPIAAPPIVTSSAGCTSTPSFPFSIKKPVMTQAKTSTIPMIENILSPSPREPHRLPGPGANNSTLVVLYRQNEGLLQRDEPSAKGHTPWAHCGSYREASGNLRIGGAPNTADAGGNLNDGTLSAEANSSPAACNSISRVNGFSSSA
jgi:HPt (histidine-containing phosphotransfer) domain-containing protein